MIEELNIIEYVEKDDDFKNNSCIICYDDDSSQRGLKCVNSHVFHEKCLYNWIKESKKYDCPLCTNEMILSKYIFDKVMLLKITLTLITYFIFRNKS